MKVSQFVFDDAFFIKILLTKYYSDKAYIEARGLRPGKFSFQVEAIHQKTLPALDVCVFRGKKSLNMKKRNCDFPSVGRTFCAP